MIASRTRNPPRFPALPRERVEHLRRLTRGAERDLQLMRGVLRGVYLPLGRADQLDTLTTEVDELCQRTDRLLSASLKLIQGASTPGMRRL